MSWYTKIVNMIELEDISTAELIKLRDSGLDLLNSTGKFKTCVIDGETKTADEQVEMLKTAITAILAV